MSDPDATNVEALRRKLRQLGFPVQEGREIAGPPVPWRNPRVLASVASGLLLLAGWLIGRAGAPALISMVICVLVICLSP